MNSKTFSNIDETTYQKIQAKLSEMGLQLSGNSGSVSKMGVSASYKYDSAAKTLDISNVEVGFPASFAGYTADKILAQVQDALDKQL
jgi:hypothetical protein